MKRNYDIRTFSKDEHSSYYRNILAHLCNTFLNTINRYDYLPKIIAIVLEDDLIRAIELNGAGATEMYGLQLESLANEFQAIVSKFKNFLPNKAKRENRPHILWTLPTMHVNHTKSNEAHRLRIETCMKNIMERQDNMSALNLLQIWDANNPFLYRAHQDRLSSDDILKFWLAIDRTIMLCDRKVFQMKAKFNNNQLPQLQTTTNSHAETTVSNLHLHDRQCTTKNRNLFETFGWVNGSNRNANNNIRNNRFKTCTFSRQQNCQIQPRRVDEFNGRIRHDDLRHRMGAEAASTSTTNYRLRIATRESNNKDETEEKNSTTTDERGRHVAHIHPRRHLFPLEEGNNTSEEEDEV